MNQKLWTVFCSGEATPTHYPASERPCGLLPAPWGRRIYPLPHSETVVSRGSLGSTNNYRKIKICQGIERWFRGQGHLFLLQKARVQFPTSHGGSQPSVTLIQKIICPLLTSVSTRHAHGTHTCRKSLIQIQFKKILKKENTPSTAGKLITQWVRALATKPDTLSSVMVFLDRTPWVPHGRKRELTVTSCLLTSTYMPWHVYTHTHK